MAFPESAQVIARQRLPQLFLVAIVFVGSLFNLEVNRWLLAVFDVLAFGLLIFSIRRQSSRAGTDLLGVSLSVFLFVGLFGSWFSGSRYESVIQANWLFLYAVVFWVSRKLSWRERWAPLLSRGIFLTTLLFALIGLGLWLKNPSERFVGLLQNANAAGPFLLVGLILGASLLGIERGWRRGFVAVGSSLVAVTLLLTSSYTAWAAAAATAILWLVVRRRKPSFPALRLGFLLIGGVFILFFGLTRLAVPAENREGLVGAIIPAAHVESSFSQRLEFQRVAIEMFLDHPFDGVGLSQYQNSYPQYAASISEQPRYVHNYYLQTFAEVGMVGGLAFLGFVLLLLLRAWKVLRSDDPDDRSRQSIAVAIIALILASAVDFSWQFPAVAFMFWISAGVLTSRMPAVSSQQPDASSLQRAANRRYPAILLLILAVVFLIRGLTLAYSQMQFDQAEIATPKGFFDKAAAAYDRGIRFDPDPKALRERAWYQFLVELPTKRYERTERAIADLLRGNRGDYFAHHTVGRIRFVQDRFPEAEAAYREALRLDPVFHPDFAYDLGFLYLKTGRLDDARAIAAETIGRYAFVSFTSNPRLMTQLAAHHYLLGEVAFREERFANAVKEFMKALELDRRFAPAIKRLPEAQARIDEGIPSSVQ